MYIRLRPCRAVVMLAFVHLTVSALSAFYAHLQRNVVPFGILAGFVWRAVAATSHGTPKVRAGTARQVVVVVIAGASLFCS